MKEAGIDTVSFSAHSVRGAATSAAKARGLSMAAICKSAGWSGCQTFARYYDREVQLENVSSTILRTAAEETAIVDEVMRTVSHDHGGYT